MNPALTLQFERAVNEYARWQAVPAEDRSDAPAWWWDTALAAVDETATMPVEWCATRVRTNHRGEPVYLYGLNTSADDARRLLLVYLARINELADHPEFYHLLTNS